MWYEKLFLGEKAHTFKRTPENPMAAEMVGAA
jgi:hypothetical protein